MKTVLSFTLTAAAALLSASIVEAADRTAEGCFASHTGLTLNATLDFNSKGSCGDACVGVGAAVFGTTNSTCWCGNSLPPASMKKSDSDCTTTCPGYPADLCGGTNLWSLYLTGLTTSVTNADASSSDTTTSAKSSTTASPTASAKPSVVTVVNSGQTVIVTATPSATSTSGSSSGSGSSSPSKTGIAVGVVVGLIAVAAIVGGIFLFVRNRKRREVEEEYRRNAAVSSFIAGGKAPGSSGDTSFSDTRLEPAIMANRRMSDGSIMDNQDYSRRILKVTNA